MNEDGDFFITWHSWKQNDNGKNEGAIYAQFFAKNGDKNGGEFKVITYSYTDFFPSWLGPSVGMDNDGSFIITWLSDSIYAQKFDRNGNKLGLEFKVNTTFESFSIEDPPKVSMDSDGDFVINWVGFDEKLKSDIIAQRFDSKGNKVGNEIIC